MVSVVTLVTAAVAVVTTVARDEPVARADPPLTGSAVAVETFQGAAVLDASWTAQGGACLTGATGAPAPGNAQIPACPVATGPQPTPGVIPGYLQLTRAINNATGSVLYNRPIPASAGISMVFRQYQYGGTGADGIGFFLVDGSTNLTATGANGGSLGYAQKDGTQSGISGGYAGVGFDAYGNFYNDGEYRGTGCPVGQRAPTTNSGPIAPNVVTVRGPGQGLYGYCYLTATVPMPITNPNNPGTTLARPLRATTLAASEREVNVRITPDLPGSPARIIVEIRYNPSTPGDPWVPLLDIPAPAGLPATYKFGLSSSTGGSTDVHLVRGVDVRTILPLDALQLEKQVDRTGAPLPAVITAGTVIPYQYTVTNAGTQPLENLVIVDDHVASGTIACDRTTLAVAPAIGSSAVCRGSYVVTTADASAGWVTNLAVAQAVPVGIGTQVTSNQSTVTVPLVSALTLQKSVTTPPPYAVGQQVTYSYLLQNTGGSTLYNVAVEDDRIIKPSTVNCPGNTLAPTAMLTCTATYVVKAVDVGANGVLVNTARAASQTGIGQQVLSNESSGQINVFTDVGVTKTVDNPAPLVGANVTFTVVATNHGPSLAQEVVVTDLLPSDRLRFVSAAPSTGTYDSQTGRWSIGSLNVSGSATLTIVATVNTNLAVSNTATRTGMRQTDINPSNDSASVTLNPVATVDLIVTKEVDQASVPIGDLVRFTIRVTNAGPSPATGVEIYDLLPDTLVFDPSSSGDGTYDPVAGIWTVGALSVSQSAQFQVVATATALGTYTNLASLRASTPADNNSSNNSGSATVTVRSRSADLYIVKAVFPDVALVGDEVVYQIEVGNKGPDPVQDAFVKDFAPVGIALSSTVTPNVVVSTGSIVFDPDGSVRWDVGDLAPNQIERATVYAVLQTPGTKINTSVVDAPNLIDPEPGDNSNTAQLTADPRPVDVAVTKSAAARSTSDLAAVPLGDDVTFTITAVNNGPNEATNVVFDELLDPALSFVSAQPSADTTYDSVTGKWSMPVLAVGQVVTLEIVANATETGQHGNVVALSSLDQADTDPTNNRDSASVIVFSEADLAIEKTNDPSEAQPGDVVRYEITVSNNGPNDATSVSAYDPAIIDADIIGFDVPAGTSFDAVTRVWTIGDLADGASVTLGVTIRIRVRSGTFTNTVVVSTSALPDPNLDNNTDHATLFIPSADIAVTKTATPVTVPMGDDVTFTIEAVNLGPDPAQTVVVSDLLPAGLTFVSATPSIGTYSATTGAWTIGDLAPEPNPPRPRPPRPRLTIVARAAALGTHVNTALADRAGAFPFDPVAENNQASAAVAVTRAPADLVLTKHVAPTDVIVGGTVTFTFTVTNLGPAAADAAVLADTFPTGLIPNVASDPSCTVSGQNVSCAFGTLGPGESRQLTVTATAVAAGDFVNAASVTSLNPDPSPDDNAASATGTVTEASPPTPPTTPPTTPPPTTPPPTPSPPLPPTGSGAASRQLPWSLAFVVAGVAALIVSRRPRAGTRPGNTSR